MNNYFDFYGRLHHVPVTDNNPFPSGNSFLYSGEAHLLGIDLNTPRIDAAWFKCQTKYGYDRNPDGKTFPLCSHDEVVGRFMSADSTTSKMLYAQYRDQLFQVCNLPEFKPVPLLQLNPIQVYKDFKALSNEESPRKSTYKYPYILPITFRHAPQHTYFYARCAGVFVNPIHQLFFLIASMFTIVSKNNSSLVLFGFKLLKLKQNGFNLVEHLVNYIFHKKIDFKAEVEKYFPADHPIVKAMK